VQSPRTVIYILSICLLHRFIRRSFNEIKNVATNKSGVKGYAASIYYYGCLTLSKKDVCVKFKVQQIITSKSLIYLLRANYVTG